MVGHDDEYILLPVGTPLLLLTAAGGRGSCCLSAAKMKLPVFHSSLITSTVPVLVLCTRTSTAVQYVFRDNILVQYEYGTAP